MSLSYLKYILSLPSFSRVSSHYVFSSKSREIGCRHGWGSQMWSIKYSSWGMILLQLWDYETKDTVKLSALDTPNIQWWHEHRLTAEDILVQKKGSGGKKESLVKAGLKSSQPNSSQSSFIRLQGLGFQTSLVLGSILSFLGPALWIILFFHDRSHMFVAELFYHHTLWQ